MVLVFKRGAAILRCSTPACWSIAAWPKRKCNHHLKRDREYQRWKRTGVSNRVSTHPANA